MTGPLIDPYAGVDFGTATVRACVTHMHGSGQGSMDSFYDAGVRVMPFSNYYPSQPVDRGSFTDIPPDVVILDNSEQHSTTDSNLHYCPLGSTQTTVDYLNIPWRDAFDQALALLDYPDGGGITINHPAFSGLSSDAVRAFLDHDDRVLGLEIYNHMCVTFYTDYRADSALPWWDAALSSGRRCWGFMAHDHYDPDLAPYKGFNMLLIDGAVTEESALIALREGWFYGVMEPTGLTLTDFTVADHTVTVTTDNATDLRMITDQGTVTASGPSHTFTVPAGAIYARFEGDAGTNTLYTQPLMYSLTPPEPPPDPADVAGARRRRFMLMRS